MRPCALLLIFHRFGRKPTILGCFIGVLGCMFGVSFSTSVEMYMVFRAGTAAFSYGCTIGTFVYSKYNCIWYLHNI